MPSCTNCGADLLPGTASCTACGHPSGQTLAGKDRPDSITLTWSRKIPLITNPVLIKDSFLAMSGACLFISAILVLITGEPALFILLFAVFGGFYLLCLLIMLVLQIAYKGGLSTQFFVTGEGVSHLAGKETQMLDRISAAGSASMGSMAGTGAGLIAVSQEANFLAWQDIRYVRVWTGMLLIELRSKYLISPVVLYCTDDNFNTVLQLVQKNIPTSASVKVR